MGCVHSSFLKILVVVAAGVMSASPVWSQSGVPDNVLAAGRADFMTYCATCHGRTGIGNGPVAKQLVTQPADLTVLKKSNGGTFPEERIHMTIDGRKIVMGHGSRDMPIWGNWFKFIARVGDPNRVDDETADIIAALRVQGLIEYLNTIQKD